MTKAQIMPLAVGITGRPDVTNIDSMLTAILLDLSGRADFLITYKAINMTLAKWEYNIPVDFTIPLIRKPLFIADDEGTEVRKADDLRDFLYERGNGTGKGRPYVWLPSGKEVTSGTPAVTVYSPFMLIHFVPDAAYAFNLHYSYYHPNTPDNIQFSDKFLEAIVQGICWKIYASKEMSNEAAMKFKEYEMEIDKLISVIPIQGMLTQYNDL